MGTIFFEEKKIKKYIWSPHYRKQSKMKAVCPSKFSNDVIGDGDRKGNLKNNNVSNAKS